MADQLKVEWLTPDGRGGGRTATGTFRATGAILGSEIRPTQSKSKGRTLEVSAFDVVAPSPHERIHPCPVQEQCGGCDLGTLDQGARTSALQTIVKRALNLPTLRWVTSPRTQRHRARIKLALRPEGIGYLQPRSHALVPIEDCHSAREEITARIEEVRAAGLQKGSVEIRSNGTRAVLAFEGSGGTGGCEHAALDGRRVSGDPTLQLSVAGLQLRASPRSFFQVNLEGNEALVAEVVRAVDEVAAERILDLYAGIGNLSLPLATLGAPVTAVELEGQATKDLVHNARVNDLKVEVHTAKVERFDPTTTPFDVVVLDPPRSGCARVFPNLLMQRPKRIVLVSCNVVAAARDIRPVLAAGYTLSRVTGFDLFPDTHHVETVLVLDRP